MKTTIYIYIRRFLLLVVVLTVLSNSIFQQTYAFGTSTDYPVGWYSYIFMPQQDPAFFTKLKATGANFVLAWPEIWGGSTDQTVASYLQSAQAAGVQVMMSIRAPSNEATLKARLANTAIVGSPALTSWYIADEPEGSGAPPAYLYPDVHSATTVKPAGVVHYYYGFDDTYGAITDILMLDHYPGFGVTSLPTFASPIGESYTYWKNGVAWVKTNHKTAFIAVPQGFDGPRVMTEAEYRFHAVSAVVAGADGVLFWHTDPPDGNVTQWETINSTSVINKVIGYIHDIGPQMQATSSDPNRGVNDPKVIMSGATTNQIVYRYGESGGKQEILAMNINNYSGNNTGVAVNGVKFTFPGAGSGNIEVVDESRTLTMTNGTFTDNFAPYEIHAYRISANGGNVSPVPTISQPAGTGTQINMTLLLHGIGQGGDNVNANTNGTTNPLHPQRTVSLEITDINGQKTTKQGTVTYNATAGNFQGAVNLGTISSGAFTMRVAMSGYLGKILPGIIVLTNGQTSTVPAQNLTTGDVNGDNKLNVLDYNMILDCFSDLGPARNCSDANKKLMADLTDDGSVNQFDYNLFLRELSVQSGQ